MLGAVVRPDPFPATRLPGHSPDRSQKDWTTMERIVRLVEDWLPKPRILHPWPDARFAVRHPRWEKLWGGWRRLWHLHRPHQLMEAAPCCKSMISAEAWSRLIRSRP